MKKKSRKSQINPLCLTGYRVYSINKGKVLRVCCKDNKTSFTQRTNASFRGKNIWSNAVLSFGISSPKSENSVIIYSPSMWMQRKLKFCGPQNISAASQRNSDAAFCRKKKKTENSFTQLVWHDQRLHKPESLNEFEKRTFTAREPNSDVPQCFTPTLNIWAVKVQYVRTDHLLDSYWGKKKKKKITVAAISLFALLAQLAVQLAVHTGSLRNCLCVG